MSAVHAKFAATRRELADVLIERDAEIDLVLTAMIAQENVLLVGDPGTGKSMLANAITDWLQGKQFSLLVNKYTTPEEVFGPISINGLKQDRYRRIITDRLPEADVAFIDEIFKASSAILNTMLQVLNERTFLNDGTLVKCPLKLCIAASNEWPGDGENGKELGALFDRFTFRKHVRPIGTDRGLNRLLWSPDLQITLSTALTATDLMDATAEASALPWTNDAKDAFETIRREARKEGIITGDRRLRKAVRAAQAFAWLNGAAGVEPDHMEILAHVLWSDPAEQPRTLEEIVAKTANPTAMQISSLLLQAEEIIRATEADLKDIAKLAVGCKKLGEIHEKLKKIASPKAETARVYIGDKILALREATLNAV